MMYLKIDGYSVPYPNGFTMEKTQNIVSEIVTISGNTIADVNGWKYAEQTFQWDTLLDRDLQNLLSGIANGIFTFEFEDIDGSHTINAILESKVNTKTRMTHNGNIVWKDIQIKVSFPDCYH